MAYSSSPATDRSAMDPLSPEQLLRIQAELERIAISAHFKASKRSMRLLRYVVDKTSRGEAQHLKERILGVELFGRDPAFDTSGDATVRVAAGEVRRRLGQFYAENPKSGLRLHLPAGSYTVEFHWDEEPLPGPAVPPPVTRRWKFLAAAVAVSAAVVFLIARSPVRQNADFDEFWKPVLGSSQPAVVSVGLVDSYHLHSKEPLRISQIGYPMVPLGDSVALSRITAMLTRQQKAFRMRGATETGFSDLKDASAILIGASSNRWTTIAHSQLRYSVGVVRPDQRTGIVDSQAPGDRKWIASHLWPQTIAGFDYALVSRLRDPNTGAMVVTVAGLTPFGTQAAGDFVTDAGLLGGALGDLAPGWQSKKLQLVIRTRIVGDTSGPAIVVGSYLH